MHKLDDNWYSEAHDAANSAISFKIKRLLHSEKTPFQTIDIYETTDWGNLMVIDGCVMLTTRDNFLYHEMMSHPALFTHADPKRVVIIGGGDCGTLREVLKHAEATRTKSADFPSILDGLAQLSPVAAPLRAQWELFEKAQAAQIDKAQRVQKLTADFTRRRVPIAPAAQDPASLAEAKRALAAAQQSSGAEKRKLLAHIATLAILGRGSVLPMRRLMPSMPCLSQYIRLIASPQTLLRP